MRGRLWGFVRSGAGALFLVVWAASGLSAQTPPACTERQVAEWKLVHEKQLGMAGRNRDTHYIGAFAARTKASWGAPGDFGGRNWFPADVYRKTMCGPLKKFTLYATPVTGAERDFHPYYQRPSAPFGYLFDDLGTVARGAKDIYGEITLPAAIEKTDWWELPRGATLLFNSRTVRTPLEGGPFCVYGPWAWEEFHSNQPEIHPSEQMWFRDPATDKLYWFVVQDASDRFEDERDFCSVAGQSSVCKDGPRARPWAPMSVRAEALVSYELFSERDEETQITVSHGLRGPRAVGPQEKRLTPLHHGPFGRHRLVVQRPPVADDFSVSFGGECTTEEGTRLQGYVVVRTDVQTVGGKEGYHLIEVTAPFAPKPGRAALHAEVEQVPPGLETIVWDEASRSLIGTYRIEGRLVRVPLLGAGSPEGRRVVAAPSGDAVLPSANPVPRLKDLDDFKRRSDWTRADADVSLAYEAGSEGGEGLVDVLNSALIGRRPGHPPSASDFAERRPRYERVFGRGAFTATVRATVKQGETERELPLTGDCARPPASGEVAVCFDDEKGEAIWMHNQELADVYVWTKAGFDGEVRLSAEVTDPFGQKGETRRTYSFSRTRRSLEEGLVPGFVQTWAPVAGFSDPAVLRALWNLREDETAGRRDAETSPGSGVLCGQRARRARLLHLYGLYASRDFEISSREDAALRALAGRLRGAAEDPPSCTDGGGR